jgi:hypothetical protein
MLADGADPYVMQENGSPAWMLVLFGLITFPLGLFLWHRQGPHFGLAAGGGKVSLRDTFVSAALCVSLIVLELVRNEK